MSSPPTLFAAAHDTGGCRAIAPVLGVLEGRADVRTWADGPAVEVLAGCGLAPRRLTAEDASSALPAEFDAGRPSLILVGNSVGPSLEDRFVSEARRRGIPSVGVLDSWLLYDKKFGDGRDLWAFLPDTLIVMDEHAAAEMASLGAPRPRLIPLGQPQFDALPERAARLTPARRSEARALLGARQGGSAVLFLSQDMREFYGGEEAARHTLGFDEYLCLDLLQAALARVSARRGEPVHLAAKLHPREARGKFVSREGLRVLEGDPYDLMLSADLIVGMDTILLVEAGLLGGVTLSLQPGRVGTDTLITNRLGLGRWCYDACRLEGMLEALLFDPAERSAAVASMRRFPVRPGATRRIADFILEAMGARPR